MKAIFSVGLSHWWSEELLISFHCLCVCDVAVPSKRVIPESWCFTLQLTVMKTWACKKSTPHWTLSFTTVTRVFIERLLICCNGFRWLNKLALASIQYEATDAHPAGKSRDTQNYFCFIYLYNDIFSCYISSIF